jgi:hypothetical protein
VIAAVGLLGCSGGAPSERSPGAVTLAYSGNVDGEIEPCG